MYVYVSCVFELLYLRPPGNFYCVVIIFMFILYVVTYFDVFLDKILYVIVLWIKKKEAQNLRWPRELNALQIEKNTCKLRKQLHHFDITRAANAHNKTKQRNSLQIKLFVCIVSICRTCCQIDEDVFFFAGAFSICMCFLKLQCVELSQPPYKTAQ